jgi:zinc transport system substrate-binding protein
MKKTIKKFIKLFSVLVIGSLCLTGCFKSDSMDDIDIVVTKYPIEYAINILYGDHSHISSIYPNGVDTSTYKITKKKIKEYSKKDMLIYNGAANEGDLAISFLNNNANLKLIDVSKGLNNTTDEEELWLNPANYLMIAQNIKNDLEDYINSTVILQNIDTKYEELKLTISTYDAQLKSVAENANNKNVIVTNHALKFLSRYGFNVYSLDEKAEDFTSADYNAALAAVQGGSLSYVFMLDTDTATDKVNALTAAGAHIVKINSLSNLSDEERNSGENYETIMEAFIEALKQEVY